MHLARIVEKHRTDPRAALASFSIGRIFLEELGRLGVAIHLRERARIGLVATLEGGFIAGGVRARVADAAPVEFGGGFARLGVGMGF